MAGSPGTYDYIAHKSEKGEQTLSEHLHSVAHLAEDFAKDFAKFAAFNAGLFHDIGKYSMAFQERIRGSTIQVEHSAAGALEVEKLLKNARFMSMMLQYVIMGHHSGLPNGGTEADNDDQPSLYGRKKRKQEDYSSYLKEISDEVTEDLSLDSLIEEVVKKGRMVDVAELFAFFTRYIFSCLTDADFLDTEKFYQPDIDRDLPADFERAYSLLEERQAAFPQDTPVRMARTSLLSQVKESVENAAEINILNMPTGERVIIVTGCINALVSRVSGTFIKNKSCIA
jgi:CRISPR-associated endonuclease/helicase Cas3